MHPGEMATTTVGLRQKTVSGVGWSAGTQILVQGTRFLIAVVLARILPPADFGLMAMIMVFTGFAGLFIDMGFGSALIQRDRIEERHCSSVFWLNLVFG